MPASADHRPSQDLSDDEYRRLLVFRNALRKFLRWSDERAGELGIAPAEHQLLLAIRGHDSSLGPTIGDVADSLLLRHQSAVGLVDRVVAADLVERRTDPDDQRFVHLRLTPRGARRLRQLAASHLAELRRIGLAVAPAFYLDEPAATSTSGDRGRARRHDC